MSSPYVGIHDFIRDKRIVRCEQLCSALVSFNVQDAAQMVLYGMISSIPLGGHLLKVSSTLAVNGACHKLCIFYVPVWDNNSSVCAWMALFHVSPPHFLHF